MKIRFSSPEAKDEVKRAIQAVEAQTSAEVVVAVRSRTVHYRHIDYLAGAVTSFLALLVFLFYPEDLEIDTMPFESLAAFALGFVASVYVPPVRRLLTSRKLIERTVHQAARAAFVDLGVSKTTGRTGMLVFVSVYERRVEIVTDIGIDVPLLGAAWTQAQAELARAVRKLDVAAFVAALRSKGPMLGKVLPRAADDVNELSDEVA